MNVRQRFNKIQKFKKRKNFSRNDVLFIFDLLESQICVEGASTILNVKEDIGFGRYEEYKESENEKL